MPLSGHKVNITTSRYRMGFAETTIGSMDEMVLRARGLMLQGNSGRSMSTAVATLRTN